MAFEPFSYGNVVAQGENILAARRQRDPNSPQNQMAQLQLDAMKKQANAQPTRDPARDLAAMKAAIPVIARMKSDPNFIPQGVEQLKQYGIVGPEFSTQGRNVMELHSTLPNLEKSIMDGLQAVQALDRKPETGFTLSPGEIRFGPQGNVLARAEPKPDTGTLYPVQTDSGVTYAPRDQAIGQRPGPRTPLVQIGTGTEGGPKAPWANLPPQQQARAAERFAITADKRLADMREDLRTKQSVLSDLQRFRELNAQTATGPLAGSDVVAGIRSVLPGGADLQEMQSITSKLTPLMRQGMPGAASDRDVAMFRQATVGVNKDRPVNDSIVKAAEISLQGLADKADFYESYITQYGHDRGFEQKWREYVEANPIFDPSAPQGSYELNPDRKPWDQWMNQGKMKVEVYDPETGTWSEAE